MSVKDIARKELAGAAGISYAGLNKIIYYKASPKYNTMILIARALDDDVWNVFFDTQREPECIKVKDFKNGMVIQGKNKIKELAVKKKMSLKELVINSQVSYSELMQIMNGKSSPLFETMLLIADALNENVRDVFY